MDGQYKFILAKKHEIRHFSAAKRGRESEHYFCFLFPFAVPTLFGYSAILFGAVSEMLSTRNTQQDTFGLYLGPVLYRPSTHQHQHQLNTTMHIRLALYIAKHRPIAMDFAFLYQAIASEK